MSKKTIKYSSIFICLALALVIQGKTGQESFRSIYNKKAGKWGKNPPISLKLIRTIGGIEIKDENLVFNHPLDMAFDSSGCIYVLDSGNHRIQVLSSGGAYQRTIGRQGQGPGEFNTPLSFDIDRKGDIYVFDPGNQKIQILSPEGQLINSIHVQESSARIRCLSNDRFVLGGFKLVLIPKTHNDFPKLMTVLDNNGLVQLEFGELRDYGNNSLNTFGNWIEMDSDLDDFIYVTFLYQNRIEKYSLKGNLIWRSERNLKYSTKPIDKGFLSITEKSRQIQMPKMNQCSRGIARDGEGRIWVVTLNRQLAKTEQSVIITRPGMKKRTGSDSEEPKDIEKLEIFDRDGALLGKFLIPHRVHLIRTWGSIILLLDITESKIYQYEIKSHQH